MIKAADWIIDLGGMRGGEIMAEGTPEQVAAEPRSFTGHYLRPMLENVARIEGAMTKPRKRARKAAE